MQKTYVPMKRDVRYHNGFNPTILAVLGAIVFVFVSFFMGSAFHADREELIEKLKKEREASAMNEKLKLELASITRGRYLELKAKERLGLKKPREEEVLVLRHE
jgi:hypothetical protein